MTPRPPSVVVSPPEVVKNWLPWLEKKFPGFSWSGKHYARCGRSQSADVPGLLSHKDPLVELIKLAPTGFPTHVSLRETFQLADSKYNILEDEGMGRFDAASKAADRWRKMCGDVYQFKKSGVYDAALEPLVSLIQIRSSTASPASTTPPASKAPSEAASSASPVAPLAASATSSVAPAKIPEIGAALRDFPEFEDFDTEAAAVDDSDDEVELVRVICLCPDCVTPVPSAVAGGQRPQPQPQAETAKSISTYRLRCKTTLPLGPSGKAETTLPSAKVVKTKTKKRSIKKWKNRSINPDRPIVLPIEMVSRSEAPHRYAEAYLLMNTRKRSYVVGCTSRSHPEYLKIIELVAKLIKEEKIKMVSEAKKLVDKYVSGDIEFTT